MDCPISQIPLLEPKPKLNVGLYTENNQVVVLFDLVDKQYHFYFKSPEMVLAFAQLLLDQAVETWPDSELLKQVQG